MRRSLGVSLAHAFLIVCVSLVLRPVQAQDRTPAMAAHSKWSDERVPEVYQKWLNEDVRWIITDEERADFKKLLSNKERDEFVVAFWDRRNPTPGASHNPFKEEHYRRLAYSNTHFAAGVPGWKTDRGRFYVTFGPPDSVDRHPGFSPPSEIWKYAYVEGIGRNVVLSFTDKCRCGDYQLTNGESEPSKPRIFDPVDP